MKRGLLDIGLVLVIVFVTDNFVQARLRGGERRSRNRGHKDSDTGTCLIGGSIRCGSNTDCVGLDNNICQCKSGYNGNPYSNAGCICTKQCGVNAHCEGYNCKCNAGYLGNPYKLCVQGNCGTKFCGSNAHCERDVCVCDQGSTGNASLGCTALCGVGTCGHNAICKEGACICNPGYFGDPVKGCGGPCGGRHCVDNAYCDNGYCKCTEPLRGNAYYPFECTTVLSQHCGGRICGWNARCVNGSCECSSQSFVGDPYKICRKVACGTQRCGPNEVCTEEVGACFCKSGYYSDPATFECIKKCGETYCGPLAFCNCGSFARCDLGTCECYDGYLGNSTVGCSRPII